MNPTADELDRLADALLLLVPRIRAAAKAIRRTEAKPVRTLAKAKPKKATKGTSGSKALKRAAAKPARKTAAKKPAPAKRKSKLQPAGAIRAVADGKFGKIAARKPLAVVR
jgi:hypothetical protein